MQVADAAESASRVLEEVLAQFLDLQVPVDLNLVLEELGLGGPIIEQSRDRHGGLRWIQGKLTPVVYRIQEGHRAWTPRERFTIAHEIGHAIVEDRLRYRPSRGSEYWGLERLCDAFAARLLLPESALLDRLSRTQKGTQLLDGMLELASAGRVSVPVASRRLVECRAGTSAWGIGDSKSGAAVVTWGIENPVWLSVHRGTIIKPSHPLQIVLREETMVGEQVSASVSGWTVACRRTGSGSRLIVAWL